jgi:hypothetical protein
VEVWNKGYDHVTKAGKASAINQNLIRLTCELAWAGVLRVRVFLAATFLTAVLARVEARGATDPKDALFLGADFSEIGGPSIITFFSGGEL